MKLGDIVNRHETITAAYKLRLKSGATAYKLRTELAKLQKHLDQFAALRDDTIKATGKENVSPGDENYDEVVSILDGAVKTEVEVSINPMLTLEAIESLELSIREIDDLIFLGLLNPEATSAALPK